ncbi:MAG: hypothetical protein BWZ08_02769 [candidate division BRC1 bacterium ADurb.BinA292]|nr:MAG: hypothetical protein BWZ08_02769 [candidate division BRC1 bacterium ADurb.BinA292]
METQKPAPFGANPRRFADRDLKHRRFGLALDHFQILQHVQDAAHADFDHPRLVLPDLPRLQDDCRYAGRDRRLAQRSVRALRVHDDLAAERPREPFDLRHAQVGPHVGVVRPPDRRVVKIDPVVARPDNLFEHGVRQPARHAAVGRARKAAVQVPPVGQVARVMLQTVDIDHRDADDRSPQQFRRLVIQQITDDPDAAELIPVDRARDEQPRAVGRRADHADRHPHRRAQIRFAERKLQVADFAGRDLVAGDDQVLATRHAGSRDQVLIILPVNATPVQIEPDARFGSHLSPPALADILARHSRESRRHPAF